ncbi:sugar ABC transporter ATP-binding protein [Ancylobacter amanitiformis]|uniref:Ribose transport system ATP-binding protein n=1 Tax=Ancylobacter amanitiformis TaxID=217069 RepID=A0ABU0LTU0_9HYPH|nr:sugar ABC transporter ATP-binding protein [Ancylobacter amanitiformis]MDQ0512126.1 ribose transport system ATP-binding protein [Ancylobacter amanitiformis]
MTDATGRPDTGERQPSFREMRASGVSKSYGATVALEHADIALRAGEVHALLGENGAGKSTLVRIFTGAVIPDRGAMQLHGETYAPRSILEARQREVATAFQELSLVPNLTVAQNFLLPSLARPGRPLISARQVIARGAEILERHGLRRIDPAARVGDLPLAERQRIEIARAIENAGRVLILDEPTASLAETDWLFEQIGKARARGVAILYISHRLAEVREICTAATVLRNGRSIGTVGLGDASDGDIFEMMVGHRVEHTRRPARVAGMASAPRLAAADLAGHGLRGVSFQLGEGEILGVAALEGQGQRGLFRVLAGLETPTGGVIRVDGKATAYRTPRAALRCGSGISYLPEERKTEGILAGLSAATNVVLPFLPRVGRAGLIGRRDEEKAALPAAQNVALSPRYLGFAIGDLSGGNQQKALMARTLATGARTLLLFDPTRGVDVGTKESIYAAIRAFAEGGGSVLFYSSELPEIVQLADRCLVLYGGQVFGELEGADIAEQKLVAAMIGHGTRPPAGHASVSSAGPVHAVAESAR